MLVSLFLNFDKNEVNRDLIKQKEREQVALKKREDSLRSVINRKDEQILKVMRQSAEFEMIAKDAVKQAEKDKKRYEQIKFYAPRNDSERDSLRSKALGR